MTHHSIVPLHHTAFKTAARAATLAALLALAATVRAQPYYDTFDTGGLNPATGWLLMNSDPNYPTSYTFPQPDAFGGYAFRMQGLLPLFPGGASGGNGIGTARAAAVSTNHVYTDFYVASDLLNWQTNWFDQTNYTYVGLVARVVSPDNFATSTNWSGVAMFIWLNVNTDGKGPGTAVTGLGWVINGVMYANLPQTGTQGGVAPAAAAEWTPEPGHTYRLTFQGVGDLLTAKVYDNQDLTKPLATISGDTTLQLYAGGVFISPAPTSGWSGLCALRYHSGGDDQGVTDATFDNFYAAVTPPASLSAPATPIGMIGAPQVINRTPASWANFYSAASGITFDATTLTATNNIVASAIRLILNGVDVTSSLTITPSSSAPTNHVTFGLAGSSYSLASNIVYDASIILQDSFGRRITNVWTFDTFSEAYLAKYPNIECEDYDIGGGGSFDFPVTASGYSTNDNTWYLPAPLIYPAAINYAYPINSILWNGGALAPNYGYVGANGVQSTDATSGATTGDYYECARTAPLVGQVLNVPALIGAGGLNLNTLLPADEYRTGGGAPDLTSHGANGDWVGTQEGAAWGISVLNFEPSETLLLQNAFDTKRAKYAALNAKGVAQYGPPQAGPDATLGITDAANASWWDVEEYNVVATEGSDWFNYTHDWGTATNYNVYLRAACAATQHLYLYDGATTNRANQLGTFYCTNSLMWNWRYTPLLDGSGNPVAVSLGSAHTLRLEIDPEMPQFNAIEGGLALNYMAFVPAGQPLLVTNIVLSTTNRITSVVKGVGNFTVNVVGTPGAQYYLVTSGNIKTAMGSWTPVAGSTNTASVGGTWSATVSAAAPAYYRAVAVNPHP